jgi:Lrp/AsnC family transcriptional regulator
VRKLAQSSLDSVDLKIVRAVQDHPDFSIAELAAHVGLSHTPCWRRLKRLEADGIVRERVTLLDAQKLGLGMNVFVQVKLKQHDEDTLNALEQAARERPEIVECFSMSGDSDYLFRIVVSSVDEYERLLKTVLLHLPGVGACNSNFALKCVKLTVKLPV